MAPGRRSSLRFVVRSWRSDDGMTFSSSETSIARELATRSRPKLRGRCGIARLCLSVQLLCVIRAAERGHRSCPARAEIVERLGQRVLPVFFPIGHRGGARAFTPSGAAFEISRPPPPSQLRVPSPKNLSLGMAKLPPLGSSCTPRPSGQYVPTGQKPTQESTSCLISTQRRSQETSARTQKR